MLLCYKIQIYHILSALLYSQLFLASGLRTTVLLDQGPIMGLKIFPVTSRNAVYAYLGIPYAQSPVADQRFAPPVAHKGWNRTLLAMHMRPLCPQPSNTIYDEAADGKISRGTEMNEDCLYLNIWVSETKTIHNKAVLALITGEEVMYDWSQNRVSGVDLALDGIVVVSIQYRSNIFGWMATDNRELSGNFGLQDQQLALFWIRRNIAHFGGDPNHITLLGHGTTGAPCALAHALIRPPYKEKLFSKVIIMSGGDLTETLKTREDVLAASKFLVAKLGCQFEKPNTQLIKCLRLKSVSDLLNAFESMYDHGNDTLRIGPILPENLDSLMRNETNLSLLPPILIGITSNEGAFLEQRWVNLAREGYKSLWEYVDYSVIPRILGKYAIEERNKVKYALKWYYFGEEFGDGVKYLLYTLQRLMSEYYFELPFYQIINMLTCKASINNSALFAYVFDASNSMDMRGKVNLFGGASHSSDLLLLLGPSMFQQISRRRMHTKEEQLSRRIRLIFLDFITNVIDAFNSTLKSNEWLPFTKELPFIHIISGENISVEEKENTIGIGKILQKEKEELNSDLLIESMNKETLGFSLSNKINFGYIFHLKKLYGFWEGFIPSIQLKQFQNDMNIPLEQRNQLMQAVADVARYRKGFFAILILFTALLSILALCIYFLHRDRARMRSHSSAFQL